MHFHYHCKLNSVNTLKVITWDLNCGSHMEPALPPYVAKHDIPSRINHSARTVELELEGELCSGGIDGLRQFNNNLPFLQMFIEKRLSLLE